MMEGETMKTKFSSLVSKDYGKDTLAKFLIGAELLRVTKKYCEVTQSH